MSAPNEPAEGRLRIEDTPTTADRVRADPDRAARLLNVAYTKIVTIWREMASDESIGQAWEFSQEELGSFLYPMLDELTDEEANS